MEKYFHFQRSLIAAAINKCKLAGWAASFLILSLCAYKPCYSQAPYQFTFQGVAKDAAGKIIANSPVSLHFTLHEGDPNSNQIFEETHNVVSNASGVFNVLIGSLGGNSLNGIDWSKGTFFLKTRIDPSGGNNPNDYIDLGATQLLSVPYALLANKLPELDPISQIGQFQAGGILQKFSAEPSLIWYPRKDSFKVGMGATGESSLGEHSAALGYFSMASANYASALGRGTIANVNEGIVLGRHNDIPLVDLEGNQDSRLLQIGNGVSSENRSNALTMLGNGRIGIGSNVLNPQYLLDLGGRMRVRHTAQTPGNSARTAGIWFDDSKNTESAFIGMKTDIETGFFLDGEWQFWVNRFGNGYLEGNIIQTSDRRLKRNITPLSKSFSKLTNLSGKHYYWKDSTKSPTLQTGLIAQEVEEYFPELVSTDEKGMKAVNYIGLIPHLIESVKALKAKDEEFAALQKQLAGYQYLQSQIDTLKAEMSRQAAANTADRTNQSK